MVIRDALRQLPFGSRPSRKVLIRPDGAGCTRLHGTKAAVWESKRLRLRPFTIAGRIARIPPHPSTAVRARTLGPPDHHHHPAAKPSTNLTTGHPNRSRGVTLSGKGTRRTHRGDTRPTSHDQHRTKGEMITHRSRQSNPTDSRKIEADGSKSGVAALGGHPLSAILTPGVRPNTSRIAEYVALSRSRRLLTHRPVEIRREPPHARTNAHLSYSFGVCNGSLAPEIQPKLGSC